MLIQLPAVKIVGLILCGVLMLGNAVSGVIGMVAGGPVIKDIGDYYEITEHVGNESVSVIIPQHPTIWDDGVDEIIIRDEAGKKKKEWRYDPAKYQEFYGGLSEKEKAIIDKYNELTEHKESYRKLLEDLRKQVVDTEIDVDKNVNGYVKGSYGDYKFSGRVFDTPSKMGIDKGRISKLTITRDGVNEVNYDRGWDIKPQLNNLTVYSEIKERLEHLK